MTGTRLERMVTRARVVRAYYAIRAAADEAAAQGASYRANVNGLTDSDTEAEFHLGRQCGFVSALKILDEVLADAD